MSAVATIAALPVAAVVLSALLRSSASERLVAVPTGERWHDRATPTFGGVGIFAGLVAGIGAGLAVGAVEPVGELLGVLAGCAVLFVAGLVDDVRRLSPVAKVLAQLAAAGIAIAAGLRVELVGNDVVAVVIAFAWLVGITNAFNLLDNMDGLAATLAAIACGYFAVDAATAHPNDTVLVLALSLGLACAGFLPFNLRPGKRATVFMGDSGSQVLGFVLAAIGLASSWTVAGTTVATMLLPLLVLAIPILDTTLVTVVRLLERRPVTQGGKDHSSHRLVYYGLSEGRAVALLAIVAGAVGATGVAYNVLDDARVTVVGVLVTFVVLAQFASFLSDLEERSRSGLAPGSPSIVRALFAQPRRLAEMLADFLLVSASFLGSYVLLVGWKGTETQRAVFLSALPLALGARLVVFTAFGLYRRVWRFAGARDAAAIAVACALSGAFAAATVRILRPFADFPWQVFVLDAILCTVVVGGSRIGVRLVLEAYTRRRAGSLRRVLVVGAGRSGRSLARELVEEGTARVVGFVDDNPAARRRRFHGVTVLGELDEIGRILELSRPDEVAVTIPDAAPERLEGVISACVSARIPCYALRRQTESVTPLLEVTAE